ncbi:DNA mismatch repair protein [Mycena vulgaris]|nr:DNA mismatch repair protein [Mycena vulgaris]
MSIKPIDKTSIHRITSGQVVIDLQTAVKELVENSLDAGATNLEVRFKQYGLAAIEVIDNGGGISEENYEGLALKNHTSKLSTFTDLTTVTTFGFRGEALSSLCALCESVVVSTATQAPMGVTLEMESSGKIRHKGKVARQRGTTITLTNLFSTLPVRRKEFERNAKREFGKALTLLNAYALGPCSSRTGVRLTVSNQADKGQKSIQIRTPGTPALRESVSALWGPKALDNIVDLDLNFAVERDKVAVKRAPDSAGRPIQVVVRGLVSKFAVGSGRTGTDRQFFYVNGRPCNLSKIQKAFNEVYRSFNATQSAFIIADFILPTDSCDINVSPDKRSILIHHEANLISALKTTLETSFASSRSTYNVEKTQPKTMTQTVLSVSSSKRSSIALVVENDEEDNSPSSAQKVTEANTETPTPLPPKPQPTSKPWKAPAVATPLPQAVAKMASSLCVETSVQQSGDSPFLAPMSTSVADTTSPDIPSATPGISRPSHASSPAHISDSPIEDVVVTLDSSRATWHRKVQLTRKVPDEPESEPESTPAPSNETYARKKRRSEPDEIPQVEPPARAPAPSQQTKSARQSLRTMLAGFSSAGSQRAPEIKVDEDELESSDDEVRSVSPPISHSADQKQRAEGDVEMQVDSDPPDLAAHPGAVSSEAVPSPNNEDEDEIMLIKQDSGATEPKPPIFLDSSVIDLTDDDMFDSSELSMVALDTTISTTPSLEEAVSRPEVIRNVDGGRGDVSLHFNLSKISASWRRLHESLATASTRRPDDSSLKTIVAADALARTINKADFGSMEIVGQFNLGFIVTRRRTGEGATAMDDLFIVDQHAADEKYNFETLQQTTHIKSQKLFRSQPLELTAGTNSWRSRTSRFSVKMGSRFKTGTEDDDPRLSLTAQPVSKDTVFNMKDLEELIHLMHDQPTGQMVRCTKARAMFAMRACRKSVMIGMPLTKGQMGAVVRHMGTMDQPWNCPHGRPTMRHLSDILGDQVRKEMDWSAFG